MRDSYQSILNKAKSRKKEYRKFLDRLKIQAPSDLDQITHTLHDQAFEEIDCLDCANCCRTTGPLLKSRDITQLSLQVRMKPSDFTVQYLRVDEDGDYVFRQMPCPFLAGDQLCRVYEYRPGACREYPHTQQRNIKKILGITFQNSQICPAVARVVEGLIEYYQG